MAEPKGNTIDLADRVTIIFPTYNRWEDTYQTLVELEKHGFGELRTLIYDDCSSDSMPAKIELDFPEVLVIRGTTNVRQAVGRNILIDNTETPYALHLDDDSFPLCSNSNLAAVLDFADDNPDLLAASFPVTETGREMREEVSLSNLPYEVQTFEGCAALIRCDAFRAIGGYADWIGGPFEESELTYRGYGSGYKTIHFPAFRICHRVSEVSRDTKAILFRAFRNRALMYYELAPLISLPYVISRLCVGAVYLSVKKRTCTPVLGLFASLRLLASSRISRKPLSLSGFYYLRNLPVD